MKNAIRIGFFTVLLIGISITRTDYVLMANNQDPINLEVYPNPVVDEDFTLTSDIGITEVTLMNILGQQVLNGKYLGETNITIHYETRDNGLFILQVKTIDGRVTTKRVLFK
jgi:hypothetical protein